MATVVVASHQHLVGDEQSAVKGPLGFDIERPQTVWGAIGLNHLSPFDTVEEYLRPGLSRVHEDGLLLGTINRVGDKLVGGHWLQTVKGRGADIWFQARGLVGERFQT